jgi:hypothetical protein
MLKPKSKAVDAHSPNKPKKFKQMFACEKANGNCFLRQERSADGGFHATRGHNSQVYCDTLKTLSRAIQNKGPGMLLHDNMPPYTAASTPSLLEHFNLVIFNHPPYSPDLAPSDYHLFTYLKNRLRSQRFNNNESLWKVSKRG